MNSLPCWPPSLLLLWGLEDMFNILLYSSSSSLIQPQPQVPAALWLLMARVEKRGTENPLIMTSTPLSLLHCCRCLLCIHSAQVMIHVQGFLFSFAFSSLLPFTSFTSFYTSYSVQDQISFKNRELYTYMFLCAVFRRKLCLNPLIVQNFSHFQNPFLLIVISVSFVTFRLYLSAIFFFLCSFICFLM